MWIVYCKDQPESSLEGYVLVYVDDLLFMAPESLATALHKALSEMWEISNLEFATEEPLRFVGVEIGICEGGFWLSQSSYIDELLRAHQIPSSKKAKIPAPREWLNVDPGDQQENPTTADVRLAQRYVGELLWLSQRARPDLQFTVAIAASLALHQPKRVAGIAMRTLAYLQTTRHYRLRCVPRPTTAWIWWHTVTQVLRQRAREVTAAPLSSSMMWQYVGGARANLLRLSLQLNQN